MHFMYGVANGNAREAVRLYRMRFPNRALPDRRIFQRLHRQLSETGSFRGQRQDTGRPRTSRTTNRVEAILEAVDNQPERSTRTIAREQGCHHTTVWRVLREERLHPYHLQPVQALNTTDFPQRVTFARWFLQQSILQPQFAVSVLFTDEATFTCDGVFNMHNNHVWAAVNPHATRSSGRQQRFSVNVWAGMIHDHLIGPYLLPDRLDGQKYLIFLQQVLPDLLQHVPANVRRIMWFQHDGAPAHFSRNVRNYLDTAFPNRWIGRGGPVSWPPRSPDLSCLDFFLWGQLKSAVYETPIASPEDLVARISAAAADVRDMPGIFQRVQDSIHRRCEACIAAGGRSFEHLL